MRVLICGAGIAGLTLARVLAMQRFNVALCEQSPTVQTGGLGIVLHPNGMGVLRRLGLAQKVYASGQVIRRMEIERSEARLSLCLQEVWEGVDTVGILRPELHRILLEASMQEPRINIRLGRRILEVRSFENSPTVYFDDGRVEQFDLVIGADGVHSKIRRSLVPEAMAISTGLIYFRFLAEKITALPFDRWHTVEKSGSSYGFIPLGRGCFHCFVQFQANQLPYQPGGEEDYFRSTFLNCSPYLTSAWEARKGPLHAGFAYMVRPIQWGRGSVVLLGDAAHALSPTLSSGGSLAMEDALVLGLELHNSGTPTKAIERFIAARQERVSWAQKMALAQTNAIRRPSSVTKSNSSIATQYMRQIYAPFRKDPVPESLSNILTKLLS